MLELLKAEAAMTYRERREAKAERLKEWAGKRESKAETLQKANEPYLGDHALATQPGRIPERDRMNARDAKAWEHQTKAANFRDRAAGIEAAAENAIYSDDPDAVERLQERIAELEQKQTTMKARNTEYRKDHGAELKGKSVWEKNQVLPHASWELTNLSGNLGRQRKRLAQLESKR